MTIVRLYRAAMFVCKLTFLKLSLCSYPDLARSKNLGAENKFHCMPAQSEAMDGQKLNYQLNEFKKRSFKSDILLINFT